MENVASADQAHHEKTDELLKNGGDHLKPFEVTIVYNGLEKPLTVTKNELVGDVYRRVIELFGVPSNPAHMLALFTADKGELQNGQTVREAGITKHEKVLLRPSTVRAG